MNFLKTNPCVFVIGKEYEIVVLLRKCGLVSIGVGEEIFYPENNGVLKSETDIHKIRVPMEALDSAEGYTVIYRESIDRKRYRSVFGDREHAIFSFKPVKRGAPIRAYHIADVHYRFEVAKATCSYLGDGTDLYILGGDIGECDTVENYHEVLKFVGELAGGTIPVLFVRGNHDARGRHAELYSKFFPTNGEKTYFTFEIGDIKGIALDCGEDKPDAHPEYSGTGAFEIYRRRELDFLRSLEGEYDVAVSHICPARVIPEAGSIFDIEREVYGKWNEELERLGVKLMLTGHLHELEYLPPNDKKSLLPHSYHIVVGSACPEEDGRLSGAALELSKDGATILFTNEKRECVEEHKLNF